MVDYILSDFLNQVNMNKNLMFPTPSAPKTTGQKVADMAITLILIGFISYVFEKFFQLLLKPFLYLLMRPEDFRELYVEKALEKTENRNERAELFKQDESDPMVQYRLRYIEHPERFTADSGNEKYLRWYKDWRDGNVDDPELRWAPDVYSEGELNPDFVAYIGLQTKLLSICGDKKTFLKVIRKFYPELTPKFPEILEDVEELKSLMEEKHLQSELFGELKSMGISDGLVKEVMKMKPEKIQGAAQYLKKCSEFGFSDSICMTLMEMGLDPSSEMAQVVNEWMTKALVPAHVMISLGKGDIEMEDVKEIAKEIGTVCDTWGLMFAYSKREEDGKCLIDDHIDEILNRATERTRSKKVYGKIGGRAW